MSKQEVMEAIKQLPLTDQEEIRQELADHLNQTPGSLLSDAQFAEIERRQAQFVGDPASGKSLEQLEVLRRTRRANLRG